MSADFTQAKLASSILHYTGQKYSGEAMIACDEPLPSEHEDFADFVAYLFQKNCKEPQKYIFSEAGEKNWQESFQTYNQNKDIAAISLSVLRKLHQLTESPSILAGELMVAAFDNVEIDNQNYHAIGFIKTDSMQTFLKCKYKKSDIDLSLESGIMADNIEKSCLFFMSENFSDLFCVVKDRELKNHQQAWWGNDLFGLVPKADKLAYTNSVMQVAKNFMAKEIDKIADISKPEKVELLTKTADYFKETPHYDEKKFVQSVFEEQPELADGFSRFKEATFQDWNLENKTKFDIEEDTAKKQAKIFKSVLKLDKNFHIYIHGNRQLIEKGFDEEKGKHYYKVFFDSEN